MSVTSPSGCLGLAFRSLERTRCLGSELDDRRGFTALSGCPGVPHLLTRLEGLAS